MIAHNTTHIVTRFAPSPTGFLHIGGVRTALFNWAFARRHGGQFLLRIEDTDRERSTAEAVQAILEGMDWLGLTPDAPPVYQHQQISRHCEIAQELLDKEQAYKCYCTKQELEEMRAQAQKAGQKISYNGHCREKDTTHMPSDMPFVIRFKAPHTGHTHIEDTVQGVVEVANDELDDLILLRSDGTPTYMLSVVVDDFDMGITHVIRGNDHLTNAIRQSQIYTALNWQQPIQTHIPLIHGSDGTKLSKRHGALGVEAYADMGYLPIAMQNYLARLGWSHGDAELFTTEELVSWFDLKGIGKSPARFDSKKLAHINAHHIGQASTMELFQQMVKRQADLSTHEAALIKAIPLIQDKSKSLDDLIEQTKFLTVIPPLEIEEKLAKTLDAERLELLRRLAPMLNDIADWHQPHLTSCLENFMEVENIKMGHIGPALRACLTGSTQSPNLHDVLFLLGKAEALARIHAQIS